VSYALNRTGDGEVVAAPAEMDKIMGFGFNWAPPSVLVDVMGLDETRRAMEKCGLAVPAVLRQAKAGERLFRQPNVNIGRFFAG
jgi:3-hydroxyacyl-CoA dehydrogenase